MEKVNGVSIDVTFASCLERMKIPRAEKAGEGSG